MYTWYPVWFSILSFRNSSDRYRLNDYISSTLEKNSTTRLLTSLTCLKSSIGYDGLLIKLKSFLSLPYCLILLIQGYSFLLQYTETQWQIITKLKHEPHYRLVTFTISFIYLFIYDIRKTAKTILITNMLIIQQFLCATLIPSFQLNKYNNISILFVRGQSNGKLKLYKTKSIREMSLWIETDALYRYQIIIISYRIEYLLKHFWIKIHKRITRRMNTIKMKSASQCNSRLFFLRSSLKSVLCTENITLICKAMITIPFNLMTFRYEDRPIFDGRHWTRTLLVRHECLNYARKSTRCSWTFKKLIRKCDNTIFTSGFRITYERASYPSNVFFENSGKSY